MSEASLLGVGKKAQMASCIVVCVSDGSGQVKRTEMGECWILLG